MPRGLRNFNLKGLRGKAKGGFKTRKKPVRVEVFSGRRIGNQMPKGQMIKFMDENMKRLRPPGRITGKISR